MEQGRGKAAVAEGDVKKTGAETVADVVQACVGAAGEGGAASPRAGSPVAAAADLEVKKVAVSDSAVPELGMTASSGASHGPAEAGGEHVDLQEVESAGMKRKLANTGFKEPYESDFDDDAVYEYESGDDVDDGNKESFIEKEAQKNREKGKAAYYKRGTFRCPYYTTKPKPKDGLYEHLMSHARSLSTSADDIKIRAEHAALLKALGPN